MSKHDGKIGERVIKPPREMHRETVSPDTVRTRYAVLARELKRIRSYSPGRNRDLCRRHYRSAPAVALFGGQREVESGLFPGEQRLYRKHLPRKGDVLVVGCGGGREVLPLAKAGHRVTGIDIVGELIQRARYWARRYGLKARFETRDIYTYVPAPNSFDLIAFTIYPLILPRTARIAILKRLNRALREGGLISINYRSPKDHFILKDRRLMRFFESINPSYEYRDYRIFGNCFAHRFTRAEVIDETAEAGFDVVDWVFKKPPWSSRRYGVALLRKRPGTR